MSRNPISGFRPAVRRGSRHGQRHARPRAGGTEAVPGEMAAPPCLHQQPVLRPQRDLVFIGLRMSLDTSGKTFETGALMLSLLGYTLLLATTACLLIRLGNVWDDVRTLLLLVVAMFLAISVTFDETLAGNPRLGRVLYLGGLLFAVAVSEGLLRGIRLRLPALFRAPYYLILTLFFLYPVAAHAADPRPGQPGASVDALRLLADGGARVPQPHPGDPNGDRAYVAKNGSPWRYPLYPWVLFGLLGAAVCGRSFYLCISFHFVGKSDSIFGPYFLVPFLFAVDLLVARSGRRVAEPRRPSGRR